MGPSYPSQSLSADAQITLNAYLERDEGNGEKAHWMLYNTPGLAVWDNIIASGGAGKGRGIYTVLTTGRTFAVVGTDLWEVFASGITPIKRSTSTMANDGDPVSFASNTIQLAIASGGTLYVLTFPNTWTGAVSVNSQSIVKIGYSDGFGIALYANSNQLAVSAPLDFTTWSGTAVFAVSVFPDLVLDLIVDHRELVLLGQTKTVFYYNDGGNPVPYDVVPGGFVDQGSAAIWGSAQLDNTVFWIGNDARGSGIVWKMAGYTPQRVSNHAVENDLRKYQTRNDAIAYGYTENGHAFYRIVFPTAGTCWTLDVTATAQAGGVPQWHQRAFWNKATGKFQAPLGQFHTYNDSFNAHLVLDPNGIVYQSSVDFSDDAGNPIRRVRRSAYVSKMGQWVYGKKIEIETNMGDGPISPLTDGDGNPRAPQMMLRWSDTSTRTWSNEYILNLGQAGEYGNRAILNRLGRWWGTHGRVFELSWSDPGIKGLVEADLTLF